MTIIRLSTSADIRTLRPKIMRELYGAQVVALCGPRQSDDVYHLLWGVSDWADAEHRFGETVAAWRPTSNAWFSPEIGGESERLTVTALYALIGTGTVCALGKDCPKHRR